MKNIFLLIFLSITLISNSQTYKIIRKQVILESNGTKKQIIGEALKEQINPFYGLNKVWPKKYKATLNINDSLATFEDADGKLDLIVKNKVINNGVIMSIDCKDIDGNDYSYIVSPTFIMLNYQGNDTKSDKVIIRQIIFSIN